MREEWNIRNTFSLDHLKNKFILSGSWQIKIFNFLNLVERWNSENL